VSSEVVCVWAVIAAYQRPRELARLLRSLAAEQPVLAGVFVVDNGGDAETQAVLNTAPLPIRHLAPGRNLGCGGGVAFGLREGVASTAATHFWQLDDDAEVCKGALQAMLAALGDKNADAAVPLVVNPEGRVCWFPGPLPHKGWRDLGREVITPKIFRQRFGSGPLAWSWSPWTSLLVTRRAVAERGTPRDDYWFQGEDIEYTLRLSARFRCVLVPESVCVHHSHLGGGGTAAFLKKCALLQNNSFTFMRLPHGRRARRHLPGNFWRFLREERFRITAMAASFLAFWRGAVRGAPAGASGADQFRQQWEREIATRRQAS
jgi:GT2 family glycosyltransferase